jgi:hypothetical protein
VYQFAGGGKIRFTKFLKLRKSDIANDILSMRKLKKEEYDLIVFLLKDKPDTGHIIAELPELFVEEMNDGGMGSIRFESKNGKRTAFFGKQIAEVNLSDIDGTPLSISVNLDSEGEIFELDIWKVDFSPLKQFPLPPYNEL